MAPFDFGKASQRKSEPFSSLLSFWTPEVLETQLDGSCSLAFGIIGIVSALLLHKDKLRLSSALLPTFGNKRKRRSVTVRSQEFSRLIFLTARKKNFCAPFKKEGETKGVTGSNLPHLHQVLFRKSKWVNIQVGRREEEPLGKASFFASLSELYTMRTRIRLRAYYYVLITIIERTVVVVPTKMKRGAYSQFCF